MIGVALRYSDPSIIKEFFQLFKTPWEFYRSERLYDVIISEDPDFTSIKSRLVITFDSKIVNVIPNRQKKHEAILFKAEETVFPVYLGAKKISGDAPFLVIEKNGESVGTRSYDSGKTVLKIGFNFFREAEYLLIYGQPAELAEYPTLDIHIANLRKWIIASGSPVVEVPPVPNGHKFFVCLSHDVDFAGIRNHKFDRTLLGFLYRASIESIIRFFKRRLSFRKMIQNWAAVSLPLVFWGITSDFWIQFRRYALIDKGLGSTFFLVPFKEKSGAMSSADAPAIRKVRYDLEDIRDEINKLLEMGFEIGVHGLDAWTDLNKGKAEYAKIKKFFCRSNLGVRIHWLYFKQGSPKLIEQAGYSYDSSVGYNGAVGFRSGTTQAYHLPGTRGLFELPLHIQDTAMFYPDRMNLSEAKAAGCVQKIIDCAARFGGVITLNWHHRSIAPERCWDTFYQQILNDLKKMGVKFSSTGDIVNWFRLRRSVKFEVVENKPSGFKVKLHGLRQENINKMVLRFHEPRRRDGNKESQGPYKSKFRDIPINKSEFQFPF